MIGYFCNRRLSNNLITVLRTISYYSDYLKGNNVYVTTKDGEVCLHYDKYNGCKRNGVASVKDNYELEYGDIYTFISSYYQLSWPINLRNKKQYAKFINDVIYSYMNYFYDKNGIV